MVPSLSRRRDHIWRSFPLSSPEGGTLGRRVYGGSTRKPGQCARGSSFATPLRCCTTGRMEPARFPDESLFRWTGLRSAPPCGPSSNRKPHPSDRSGRHSWPQTRWLVRILGFALLRERTRATRGRSTLVATLAASPTLRQVPRSRFVVSHFSGATENRFYTYLCVHSAAREGCCESGSSTMRADETIGSCKTALHERKFLRFSITDTNTSNRRERRLHFCIVWKRNCT